MLLKTKLKLVALVLVVMAFLMYGMGLMWLYDLHQPLIAFLVFLPSASMLAVTALKFLSS
jgi:hypothetical protein